MMAISESAHALGGLVPVVGWGRPHRFPAFIADVPGDLLFDPGAQVDNVDPPVVELFVVPVTGVGDEFLVPFFVFVFTT